MDIWHAVRRRGSAGEGWHYCRLHVHIDVLALRRVCTHVAWPCNMAVCVLLLQVEGQASCHLLECAMCHVLQLSLEADAALRVPAFVLSMAGI